MILVLLFVLGVIGVTHIIVDPAAIVQKPRNWSEKNLPVWFNDLISCYQCCGFWIGVILGIPMFLSVIGLHWLIGLPLLFFTCGGAGSFVATLSAVYLNYLESQSVIDISDTEIVNNLEKIQDGINILLEVSITDEEE